MGKSFYGDFDKGSQMPGWFFDKQIEDLEDTIRYKTRALEQDHVPASEKAEFRASLKRDEERIDKIKNSKPVLSGAEIDKLVKQRDELESVIRDSMYSRSDMHKGIADANTEMKRAIDPCIRINKELADMAKIELDGKGRCSRDKAILAWQLTQKFLDDERGTNAEVLRRD